MWPGAWRSACRAASAWSRAARSALSADAGGLSLAALIACRPAVNRAMSARTGWSPRSIRSFTTFASLDTGPHLRVCRPRGDPRHELPDRLAAGDELAGDAPVGVDEHGH